MLQLLMKQREDMHAKVTSRPTVNDSYSLDEVQTESPLGGYVRTPVAQLIPEFALTLPVGRGREMIEALKARLREKALAKNNISSIQCRPTLKQRARGLTGRRRMGIDGRASARPMRGPKARSTGDQPIGDSSTDRHSNQRTE